MGSGTPRSTEIFGNNLKMCHKSVRCRWRGRPQWTTTIVKGNDNNESITPEPSRRYEHLSAERPSGIIHNDRSCCQQVVVLVALDAVREVLETLDAPASNTAGIPF